MIRNIVTGYNDTFGRFTLEDRAGEKVTMFVEDFDGFELGGVEVQQVRSLCFPHKGTGYHPNFVETE